MSPHDIRVREWYECFIDSRRLTYKYELAG